jgi:hypothetical protein
LYTIEEHFKIPENTELKTKEGYAVHLFLKNIDINRVTLTNQPFSNCLTNKKLTRFCIYFLFCIWIS